MARCQILYWQNIPSLVEVRQGRKVVHKELLSERFQALIDTVAMKLGLEGTDAYLEQWRKETVDASSLLDASNLPIAGDDPGALAKAVAKRLEDNFRGIRDAAMNSIDAN